MKKLLFFAVACLIAACSGKTEKVALEEMKFQKGIFITPETKVVDICFENGESPYFDVYMTKGTPEENVIWFSFFNAADIDNGQVRPGCRPCRYYQVVIPSTETAKSWGYGGMVTTRKDGGEHRVTWNFVNQPD